MTGSVAVEWRREMEERLGVEGSGSVLRWGELMARRTTMRVGGVADCYCEPGHEEALGIVLAVCREYEVPWVVIGRGSNALVADDGVRGVVIGLHRPAFAQVQLDGTRVKAGAGARLRDVAQAARRAGLAGLEFMEGIPGNVGGGLRMNAGAMGASVFERLEQVRWMNGDGSIEEKDAKSVAVGYRSCPELRDRIALGAVFETEQSRPESVEERMRAYSERRWRSQPAAPSAGCMFKNPAAIAAGRLIDELGLKGLKMGGAQVSEVHGNFMVNGGNASAADVLQLIRHVQRVALEQRGVRLEMEVQLLGDHRLEEAKE